MHADTGKAFKRTSDGVINLIKLLLRKSNVLPGELACGVVVSMFDFHRSDRGSNPGRGGEFS